MYAHTFRSSCRSRRADAVLVKALTWIPTTDWIKSHREFFFTAMKKQLYFILYNPSKRSCIQSCEVPSSTLYFFYIKQDTFFINSVHLRVMLMGTSIEFFTVRFVILFCTQLKFIWIKYVVEAAMHVYGKQTQTSSRLLSLRFLLEQAVESCRSRSRLFDSAWDVKNILWKHWKTRYDDKQLMTTYFTASIQSSPKTRAIRTQGGACMHKNTLSMQPNQRVGSAKSALLIYSQKYEDHQKMYTYAYTMYIYKFM